MHQTRFPGEICSFAGIGKGRCRSRASALQLLSLLALALLVACGPDDGPASSETPSPTEAPTLLPNTGPEAACDGIDGDHDGIVDDGITTTWYQDADGDGYGVAEAAIQACAMPVGYAQVTGDCDDSDPSIHRGAEERCNLIDDDCDDRIDDVTTVVWYLDADGDGHGGTEHIYRGCSPPDSYVPTPDDCDDEDPSICPGAPEQCNERDDDCDASVDEELPTTTWYLDADHDGYGTEAATREQCGQPSGYVQNTDDCDDTRASASPADPESCDGVDNDCDGAVDEDLTYKLWYLDQDGDDFGSEPLLACAYPAGYTFDGGDCDDLDPLVHPAAIEACNDRDDDCDGLIEDEAALFRWFPDTDGDGYGVTTRGVTGCVQPDGYVPDAEDCDDGDPAVRPGALERCDGRDEDCDGEIDEGQNHALSYPDQDGDGYGAGPGRYTCAPAAAEVTTPGDCEDRDAARSPAALEACNGLDDDCDELADEGILTPRWYPDADGDGFGDQILAVESCTRPEGYLEVRGDCDDGDAAVHPGAPDIAGDGLDADCGGTGGPEPHAGFPGSGFTSIQAALDAAAPGATVWIGPGTYLEHSLSFQGKPGHLAATHPAAETVVDAGFAGPVVVFEAGEGSSTLLEGFTLTHGRAAQGGGMQIRGSSPTIRDCVVSDSLAGQSGAGVYLELGAPTFIRTRFHGHRIDPAPEEGGTAGQTRMGYGVGLHLFQAAPIFQDCVISGNETFWSDSVDLEAGGGAGLYLEQSSPQLDRCQVVDNVTYGAPGAGLLIRGGAPVLSGCLIAGNQARSAQNPSNRSLRYADGAGLALVDAAPHLEDCLIMGNRALPASWRKGYQPNSYTWITYWGENAGFGGGLHLSGSSPVLTRCRLMRNQAESGGAVYATASSPTLTHCDILQNRASAGYQRESVKESWINDFVYEEYLTHRGGDGGGLNLSNAPATIAHCFIAGNLASNGGGMRVTGPARLEHSVLVANGHETVLGYAYDSNAWFITTTFSMHGGRGGGIYSAGTDAGVLEVDHSILAWNRGLNLFTASEILPRVRWSDLYAPAWWPRGNHNLGELEATNLAVDPGFLAAGPQRDPGAWEVRLRPGSPLIDAGDPDGADPDGSRPDIGRYSGVDADWSGYLDEEGDGLYDTWEARYGLATDRQDGDEDPDGDGLRNRGELETGTRPDVPDSDGDGFADGEEVEAGSGALNPSSRPGFDGLVGLRVPEEYPTVQAAIDASSWEGAVDVGPGVWQESLRIMGRRLELTGREGELSTVLRGNGDQVVRADEAWLEMRGVTITGGRGTRGGGLEMRGVSGTLAGVRVTGNRATYGAGMYLEGLGPALEQCTLAANTGDFGGGLYLWASSPRLDRVLIRGNSAKQGGGMLVESGSAPRVRNSVVMRNTDGIAIYHAGEGMQVEASILVYNTRDIHEGEWDAPVVIPLLWYSDVYSPGGEYGAEDPIELHLEPGFLAYDLRGMPILAHLAYDSPLLDRGPPERSDADGSRSDPGIYGGEGGDGWDRDLDGAPDWFWPGTLEAAPEGFDPAEFDCDDMDGSRSQCESE